MTIAEHCLRLLKESGPLTAEELGRSCAAAGLTNAKDPALSVGGSLSWNTDGRAVRLEDGRLALVTALLEGRWLTTPAPAHGRPLDPGLDLNPLRGPVARDGVELLSGGTVGSPWWSHPWTGPPGWLPATGEDGLLGFRLRDGLLEVAEVGLGDDAAARGHALAERVLALAPKSVASSYYCDRKLSRALLQVLHGDPDALREPVPPLRTLLPSGQSHQGPGYGGPGRLPGYADGVLLTLTLPCELRAELDAAAEATGQPLATWLVEQLEALSAWPQERWRRRIPADTLYGIPADTLYGIPADTSYGVTPPDDWW